MLQCSGDDDAGCSCCLVVAEFAVGCGVVAEKRDDRAGEQSELRACCWGVAGAEWQCSRVGVQPSISWVKRGCQSPLLLSYCCPVFWYVVAVRWYVSCCKGLLSGAYLI